MREENEDEQILRMKELTKSKKKFDQVRFEREYRKKVAQAAEKHRKLVMDSEQKKEEELAALPFKPNILRADRQSSSSKSRNQSPFLLPNEKLLKTPQPQPRGKKTGKPDFGQRLFDQGQERSLRTQVRASLPQNEFHPKIYQKVERQNS